MTYNFETTLGSLNFTIDGAPIVLENITVKFSADYTAQELATGASFFKDLLKEIKPIINAATTPAPKVEEPAELPTGSFTGGEPIKAKPEKVDQKWDLPAVWEVMTSTLPDGFKKTGVGVCVYSYTDDNGRTTIRISFKDESIDMSVRVGDTQAYFYLYEEGKRSWVNGINPTLVNELVNELPKDVKEFVRTFVKKVLNK